MPPPPPEKLDIRDVAKAADATLKQMGIVRPSGEAFRKKTLSRLRKRITPVLIFARACDINVMSRLDYMYLSNGNNSDYSYQLLREHIRFILIECPQSFENCFCVSMGSNKTDNYSAAMRFCDDGASIFIQDAFFDDALQGVGQETKYEPVFVSENPEQVSLPESIGYSPQGVREILINHPLWDEYNSRCIGCGRCTTGCPTCTCYSVFDVAYDENPQRGERRQWASCMVPGFSDMADGHCFRQSAGEHLRYWAITKPATALSICAWAADAARTVTLSILNSRVLSIK